MALLITLLKLLFLLFLTSFLCILYYLLKRQSFLYLINGNTYHYGIEQDYSHYDSIPISTNIKIIPIPKSISFENSALLLTSNDFRIISKQNINKDLELAIVRYSKYISLLTGISPNIDQNSSSSQNALIIDCSSILSEKDKYPKLGEDESYTLNTIKTGLYLHASSLTGIIRGLSTFVQLIEQDIVSKKSYVPFVNIIDRPRFVWRGLLLDVSRHWMPISVIERTLNAMELSKLNVLHLHLSDDQGFRVESLQHRLLHDKTNFFTQKDIQYLVEYARQRRIRIVPEFDIPGHTTSWFVGYPELASGPGPYQVETRWGVMQPTMDPTKESTYTFLDRFFKEMSELFPDPYFHIGGDEVEGSQWMSSPSIQTFIEEHKLGNKNGLQAYFNRRIQTMLKKYDKIMVGWEEILDEVSEQLAVDKDAVIQSWKSRKSLTNTINKGYSGILSHGYYLDYLQPSMTHYKVDPILADELRLLNEEQLSHILGGEACMWTEYVSEYTVDSRIWPRTLAIAERFWSPSSIEYQNSLYERLFRMNHLLDKMETGLTHLSSYKLRLQNLIIDPDKKTTLFHPFVILADVCEPCGMGERSNTHQYSSRVPLITFTDALQSESELVWQLERFSINNKRFQDIFQIWSVNHLRLQSLFDDVVENNKNKQLWRQDVEQLSKNLAHTGQIGLRILDYNTKKILHHDKNHTMNSWTLSHWISHHSAVLDQLENQIPEVRLAAVRPVRRLLKSIQSIG